MAAYPPYNRHLFPDIGAFTLGIAPAWAPSLVVAGALIAGLLLWWAPWSSGARRPRAVPTGLALRLDTELKAALPASGSAGLQAAVVLADGSVWTGGAGLADVDARLPMTPDLLMATGSINKMYTAALVLDLAEDGVLSLDDRVDRWVPGVPNTKGLTLRHLLTHTSGLGNITRAQAEELGREGATPWRRRSRSRRRAGPEPASTTRTPTTTCWAGSSRSPRGTRMSGPCGIGS